MIDRQIQRTQTFQELLRFTWKNSPFYRELYSKIGIHERDLSHIGIGDLPIVTKGQISENFDAVVTDPRLKAAGIRQWLEGSHNPRSRYLDEFIVVHTSDVSSGLAVFAYNAAAWQTMSMAAALYMWPLDIQRRSRLRNAFYVGERGHVTSVTSIVNSSAALNMPLILTLVDPVEEVLARLNSFQPDRLTSYASSMGWLAEFALAGKLRISPHDVVVSSDRLTPSVEALIQKAWNPGIYDLYAATESPFLAIRQPGMKEWLVIEELNWLEILDDHDHPVPTGEHGRAILTNLVNTVTPLIRYELNDYLIRGESQPDNITVGGFAGRTFDKLVILRDDQRSVEIPAYELLEFRVPSMEGLQFIPRRPDCLEIEYCAAANLDAEIEGAFRQFLLVRGCTRLELVIHRVDHIWNDAITLKAKLISKPDDTYLKFPLELLAAQPAGPGRHLISPKNPFVPFSLDRVESSIPFCFEQQVSRRPESIAIKAGRVALTYRELNQAANRVAHKLRTRPQTAESPVVLRFNHKPSMVIAMLGVLKAGKAYVPLDPDHPGARNAAIIEDVRAEVLLTDSEGLAAAKSLGLASVEIINLDEIDPTTGNEDLALLLPPTTPASIYYTSGSTGNPKGVLLDHRAVLHRVKLYTNDCHISDADRLSLIQLYVYNASIREIFGVLLNGSTLCLYDLKSEGIHHLAPWLLEEGITVFYAVPSVFRTFLGTLKEEGFSDLRLIRLGGEAVLPKDVAGFQQYFTDGCLLMDGLASTETGTICQYFIDHQTPVMGSQVPVGYPVEEKEIFLLDENGDPVKDGAVGEIVVESSYLGPGYYSGPGAPLDRAPVDLSQARRRFPTGDLGYHLPDGRLVVVGRKDWVVKIRGQRIILVEIEQALLALGNVADAAVTFQEKPDGGPFLAAYIQPASLPGPTIEAIRQNLRLSLPESMIPTALVILESLPRTLSGKIDHQRLPVPDFKRVETNRSPILPRTQIEKTVSTIWREVLDLEQIGVNDSFFDLGGDLIRAALMMSRVEGTFGLKLPLLSLYQHNTIAELSKLLDKEEIVKPGNALISLQPLGDKTPVYFIPGIGGEVLGLHDLVAGMGVGRPLFGLQWVAYDREANYVKSMVQTGTEYIGFIQSHQPKGPYFLVGYSMGGLIALEIGRQLLALGENVPLVVLLDTFPPGSERNTTLANRVKFHARNILRFRSAADFYNYSLDRLRRIFLRIVRHRQTRVVIEQLGIPVKDQVSAAYLVLESHHPQPYPGKVVLFKATKREWFMNWDPMEGWQNLVKGDLEIKEIQGEHLALIKGPSALELARQLNACLDESEQGR